MAQRFGAIEQSGFVEQSKMIQRLIYRAALRQPAAMLDGLGKDAVVERYIGGRKRIRQPFNERREKGSGGPFCGSGIVACRKRQQPRNRLAPVIARHAEFTQELRDDLFRRSVV